jgi:hypothetical protein
MQVQMPYAIPTVYHLYMCIIIYSAYFLPDKYKANNIMLMYIVMHNIILLNLFVYYCRGESLVVLS